MIENSMLNVRLITRNDTAERWAASTGILMQGELALDTTNGILKAGDGVHTWKDLPALNDGSGMEASSVDGQSIVINGEALSLHGWGVEYYKWVEGTDGAEGEYVLQVVDAEHPWIAGLEPKVVANEDGFELAWYEPSTVSVEEIVVNVTEITNTIGSPEDAAGGTSVYSQINEIKQTNISIQQVVDGKIDKTGGTMTGELILSDGSPAASQSFVAAEIASAGHLKREIVSELPAVAAANESTIYMVKDAQQQSYREYMLITDVFEEIGNTSVDLSGYLQKIAAPVAGNMVMMTAEGDIADAGISAAAVSSAFTKLESVEEGAEENYVKSVGEEFEVSEEGELALKSVDVSILTQEEGDVIIFNSGGSEF